MQQRPFRRLTAAIVFIASASGLAVPCAGAPPTPVSPGDAEAGTVVQGRCPTFSWTGVDAVRGYELALYRVEEETGAEAVGKAEPELLDRVRLPAGSTGWTPSLDRCLAWGGRYAWSVRAIEEDEEPGEWSEASLFEVSGAPSATEVDAAVETLERYLQAEGETERRPGVEPGRAEDAPRSGTEPPHRPPQPPGSAPMAEDGSSRAAPKAAPFVGLPSITLDSSLALGAESNLFKESHVLLWDDNAGNLALGERALDTAAGDSSNNTAVGAKALTNTFGGSSSFEGSHNSALGFEALESNATGYSNTAVGSEALHESVTAIRNTAVGRRALFTNTGSFNTAVGSWALLENTGARDNTAVGSEALRKNTTGPENTAVGSLTLRENTVGNGNTAIGKAALLDNTGGDGNVALGKAALANNSIGHRNIAVGRDAGIELGDTDSFLSTLSDNIYIGNDGRADEGGTIRIGNDSAHHRSFIAGVWDAEVTGAVVSVAPDGQLGVSTSSRRFKEGIESLDEVSERLLELEPVTFRYRPELVAGGDDAGVGASPQIGLIAEEVVEVFPELVTRDEAGEPYSVRYDLLSVLLLEELQRWHEALEHRRAHRRALDEAHRRQLAALRERLRALEADEAPADGEAPWRRRRAGISRSCRMGFGSEGIDRSAKELCEHDDRRSCEYSPTGLSMLPSRRCPSR